MGDNIDYETAQGLTLKEVIFANRKMSLLARIHFCELASLKYFAGINFRE